MDGDPNKDAGEVESATTGLAALGLAAAATDAQIWSDDGAASSSLFIATSSVVDFTTSQLVMGLAEWVASWPGRSATATDSKSCSSGCLDTRPASGRLSGLESRERWVGRVGVSPERSGLFCAS